MNARKIAEILVLTDGQEMTDAQRKTQRESFAYGNMVMDDDEVTREAIKEAAQRVLPKFTRS